MLPNGSIQKMPIVKESQGLQEAPCKAIRRSRGREDTLLVVIHTEADKDLVPLLIHIHLVVLNHVAGRPPLWGRRCHMWGDLTRLRG